MENYFERLLVQFKLSTGEYNIDLDSREFDEKFSRWIKEMDKLGKNYAKFLESQNIYFKDETVAEVGKGEYDSVVKPFDTKIITDAGASFIDVEKNRLLNGKLLIERDGLFLLSHNNGCFTLDELRTFDINTLITQNPITYKQIDGWEYVYNKKLSQIVLGLYGKIDDLDIDRKINVLKRFKSYLEEYNENFEKNNDEYYYYLTNLKIKRLVKKYRGYSHIYNIEKKEKNEKTISCSTPNNDPDKRIKTKVKIK